MLAMILSTSGPAQWGLAITRTCNHCNCIRTCKYRGRPIFSLRQPRTGVFFFNRSDGFPSFHQPGFFCYFLLDSNRLWSCTRAYLFTPQTAGGHLEMNERRVAWTTCKAAQKDCWKIPSHRHCMWRFSIIQEQSREGCIRRTLEGKSVGPISVFWHWPPAGGKHQPNL